MPQETSKIHVICVRGNATLIIPQLLTNMPLAAQEHVPQKRPCEFISNTAKRPRILSHKTTDGGHNLSPISISAGSASNINYNRNEQSSGAYRRSPSSATDSAQDVTSNCSAHLPSNVDSEQMASN